MNKYSTLVLSVLLTGSLILGCGVAGTAFAAEQIPTDVTVGQDIAELDSEAALITLSESGVSFTGEGIRLSGNTVTITAEGSYILTGALAGGQIVIDAPEDAKVKLLLNGIHLSNIGDAAIYALSADKVVLSTVSGSVNLVASSGEFSTDSNVDAAIFSRCDLTLSGEGVLNVSSAANHGVVSKDDLKIKSGTVYVEAGGKALCGKDSVTVEGGSISVDCKGDAVSTTNSEDADKGGITILGGSLNLLTRKDGFDATGNILIEDGSIVINAGDSSVRSGKGIESDTGITVNGGTLKVDAVDDAIHAADTAIINGGSLTLSTGDDGIHADSTLTVNGGEISVTGSYEGLEANDVLIAGGSVSIVAQDDGINAAGGSDGSNAWGMFGGDPFAGDSGSTLTVSGGTLLIDAMGDGLDANGELIVTGGVTFISGPTDSGNGSLDYGTGASISGGTVIAAGAAGMAENFGSGSTQGSILLNLADTQAAGSTVSIADEAGKVLADFQPVKDYSSVVISTEGMVQGGTYTVTAGAETQTITLDSLIYGSGMGMGGFGGPGMGGRQGGQMGGFGGPGMGGQPNGFGGPGMGGQQNGFGGPGMGGQPNGFGGPGMGGQQNGFDGSGTDGRQNSFGGHGRDW